MRLTVLSVFLLLFLGCDSDNSIQYSGDIGSSLVQQEPITVDAISSIPMLGILISYNNIQIQSSDAVWSSKLFGKNDHELNHYYMQTSNLKFEFKKANESARTLNDGIILVKLNRNHPDIDINSPQYDEIVYADLSAALIIADGAVDYSNYDKNADGKITPDELLFTFIIAGYEDSYEGLHVENGVWGHQSCISISSHIPVLDSVELMSCSAGGNFALFGERHNIRNPHDATIGIIAHELGHSAFNLPDLYNVNNSNSGGIGNLGIMGGGTWATQNSSEFFGNTPTHFSAWSKIYNRWATPTITRSVTATLYETASQEYNIIKIPISNSRYYLLENRNNSGYDRGLYTLDGQFNGGIAIWKIDETKLTPQHIFNNTVNIDTAAKGVDLVEAVYGSIDKNGDGGDENVLYYEENKNSFSTFITNISQRGSTMSLDID